MVETDLLFGAFEFINLFDPKDSALLIDDVPIFIFPGNLGNPKDS